MSDVPPLVAASWVAGRLPSVVPVEVATDAAGLVRFVLHELLRHPSPVRLYDGGWAEYGSLVDVPVSRRPTPLPGGPRPRPAAGP